MRWFTNAFLISASFFFVCAQAFASNLANSATLDGYVRIESDGFLRQSPDRADTSSTLTLAPQFKSQGSIFSTSVDIRAMAFTNDPSSFTVESGDTYIATSKEWSSFHQITLGRRNYDWSEADDFWAQGLWSSRFLWDTLRPEKIGLTGLFYSYQSEKWRLVAFGSPISMPERGFPVRVQNGQLTSGSQSFVPPYDQMMMMNQLVAINYSMSMPSISSLILHPAAAISLKYGDTYGPWASAEYGFMPIHQLDLAVEASLDPITSQLNATIRPRVLEQELLTFEAGFKTKEFTFWGSITGEKPFQQSVPDNWIVNAIGPALIGSIGGSYQLSNRVLVKGSYINVSESKSAISSDQIALNLPSRFPYTRATRVSTDIQILPRLISELTWTYDIAYTSNLMSLDLNYDLGSKGWQFGLGTDFLESATAQGLIGQYVGNDRFRARISYEF